MSSVATASFGSARISIPCRNHSLCHCGGMDSCRKTTTVCRIPGGGSAKRSCGTILSVRSHRGQPGSPTASRRSEERPSSGAPCTERSPSPGTLGVPPAGIQDERAHAVEGVPKRLVLEPGERAIFSVAASVPAAPSARISMTSGTMRSTAGARTSNVAVPSVTVAVPEAIAVSNTPAAQAIRLTGGSASATWTVTRTVSPAQALGHSGSTRIPPPQAGASTKKAARQEGRKHPTSKDPLADRALFFIARKQCLGIAPGHVGRGLSLVVLDRGIGAVL